MQEDSNIENSEQSVRNAYIFLLNHSRSPEAFSKEEFKRFANYSNPDNFDTYFSKKFRHFLDEAPNNQDRYLISSIFKKYSKWDKFRAYYSQSSKIKASYIEESYKNLMIFEFFMPLTNEHDLKSALDEVFYKDTVKLSLNRIPNQELFKAIPQEEEEAEVQYTERICNWISKRFGGYSIGTVRGRFKIADLKTFSEIALIRERGKDYLFDETTAIVRFIFHIGIPSKNQILYNIEQFDRNLDEDTANSDLIKEANQIRFFFKNLFVRNILDLVNGEDEIWMLESGIRYHLYIWKKELV